MSHKSKAVRGLEKSDSKSAAAEGRLTAHSPKDHGQKSKVNGPRSEVQGS